MYFRNFISKINILFNYDNRVPKNYFEILNKINIDFPVLMKPKKDKGLQSAVLILASLPWYPKKPSQFKDDSLKSSWFDFPKKLFEFLHLLPIIPVYSIPYTASVGPIKKSKKVWNHFEKPRVFSFFNKKVYFCPHIAKRATIDEVLNIAYFQKQINFWRYWPSHVNILYSIW